MPQRSKHKSHIQIAILRATREDIDELQDALAEAGLGKGVTVTEAVHAAVQFTLAEKDKSWAGARRNDHMVEVTKHPAR